MNLLYYGDNLDVLRRHVADKSVDLVYLDPPFNSNASYSVLFAERDGTQAAAQIKAFEDTWRWDQGAARAYQDVVEAGGNVSQAMQAFRTFLGESDMLAYPTQKPEALLERIISASSNEGDLVLDPFCGCGTTITAAQKLKRRWIGIDITHLAIGLIRHRLNDSYGQNVSDTYRVIGEPVSIEDAETLAASEPYQFQAWALGLVGARPAGEIKKGADKGIDGRIYFHEGDGSTRQIILSVKAGKLHAPYVRDLRGVVDREKAAIGVLLTLDEPTKAMRAEAASAGFYKSSWGQHPKLQILTVGELLVGKRLDIPPVRQVSVTYKRAPKVLSKAAEQRRIFGED